MVKKIKDEVNGNGCSFCVIKDNELKKKEGELQRLVSKVEVLQNGKPKKEHTPEQIEEMKKKSEEKKKQRDSKENEYKKLTDENKKLKHELLTKFGVQL